MTLPLPPKAKAFDPVPAGNHVARLYKITYVGTVWTEWKGEKKQTPQISITFELCNETKVFKEGEGARPLSISTGFITYSMGKKAKLRAFIEGMIGTVLDEEEAGNFNLEQLLGESCLLNVVHNESNGNLYANIKGLSPLIKGMTAPEIHNKPLTQDVNTMSQEAIDELPDFIKDKMKSSEEYDKRFRTANSDTDLAF
jgi:hypothetical protein